MGTYYTATLIQHKLSQILSNQRNAILIVFLIGVTLRIVPEVVAYPYPIGYDVVNYYIPVITNFDQHWPLVFGEFPLYVSLLHLLSQITGLSAHSTVVTMAVLMYGIFSVSVFLTSRILLKASVSSSIFITIFVIFQLSILRTTLDLHRDIVALSATFLTFCLIVASSNNRINHVYRRWKRRIIRYLRLERCAEIYDNNYNHQNTSYIQEDKYYCKFDTILIMAAILATCTIAVGTSRLVGSLFCVSVVINAIINRNSKRAIAYAAFAIMLFSVLLSMSWSTPYLLNSQAKQISNPPKEPDSVYSPQNLRMLFVVFDGVLIIPGSYAILKLMREIKKKKRQKSEQKPNLNLLLVPSIISLVGSFSWIVFPHHDLFVADRWIFLFGALFSIFAGYGIVVGLMQGRLMKQKVVENNNNKDDNIDKRSTIVPLLIGSGILVFFVFMGVSYAVMPSKHPFIVFSKVGSYTQYFAPLSMQFNAMDVKDTPKLLDTITWINKNTEPGTTIAGEKHWRGFMELYLRNGRKYVSLEYSEWKQLKLTGRDPRHLLGNETNAYLISYYASSSTPFTIRRIETQQGLIW